MTRRHSKPGADAPPTKLQQTTQEPPPRRFPLDPNAALKQILAINPRASLHEIRSFHPVFKAMSYDHLGLRVSRLIEAARGDTLQTI